jgi:hypothetical protein
MSVSDAPDPPPSPLRELAGRVTGLALDELLAAVDNLFDLAKHAGPRGARCDQEALAAGDASVAATLGPPA